jgi:hypothetical protein
VSLQGIFLFLSIPTTTSPHHISRQHYPNSQPSPKSRLESFNPHPSTSSQNFKKLLIPNNKQPSKCHPKSHLLLAPQPQDNSALQPPHPLRKSTPSNHTLRRCSNTPRNKWRLRAALPDGESRMRMALVRWRYSPMREAWTRPAAREAALASRMLALDHNQMLTTLPVATVLDQL